MNALTGARCVGMHWLFESIDLRDHKAAQELCHDCPALEACTQLLREQQTASRALRAAGGGPVGTWAGTLVGASPNPRRGRTNLREHGTDRGYQQHRFNGEPACDDCRAAHSKRTRVA